MRSIIFTDAPGFGLVNPASDALRAEVEEQLERGGASRRAREVVSIILDRGVCTTSDIEALGYKHAPRAVMDARDAGIEIVTGRESYTDPATGGTKRRATYRITGIDPLKKSRRGLTKKFSDKVKESGRCEVCGGSGRLQADHRIPFEIGGETFPHVLAEFMPLCPSCNRSKSWECEACVNWAVRDPELCRGCMWASPANYDHVATVQKRRAVVELEDEETVKLWDRFRPNVKEILERWLHDQ